MLTNEQTTARRSVAEIVADPMTPQWIKAGIARLRRDDPVYAAFIEALHDYRIGRSPSAAALPSAEG